MPEKTGKAPAKAKKAPPAEELKHPVPEDLGEAGAALWTDIVADLEEGWRFDAREVALLAEAGRVADDLAELDAAIDRDGRTVPGSRNQVVCHPGLAESRQLRALLLRLLSSLEMQDPVAAIRSATPEQARKRKAAAARWSRENRRLN
jgi:hypothetical protein